MDKENIVIKEIEIIYFWYHHLNSDVNKREVAASINNHDWKIFKKWLD